MFNELYLWCLQQWELNFSLWRATYSLTNTLCWFGILMGILWPTPEFEVTPSHNRSFLWWQERIVTLSPNSLLILFILSSYMYIFKDFYCIVSRVLLKFLFILALSPFLPVPSTITLWWFGWNGKIKGFCLFVLTTPRSFTVSNKHNVSTY